MDLLHRFVRSNGLTESLCGTSVNVRPSDVDGEVPTIFFAGVRLLEEVSIGACVYLVGGRYIYCLLCSNLGQRTTIELTNNDSKILQ